MLAYKINNVWTVWAGEQRPLNGDGLYSLPSNAETAFSEVELSSFGLFRVFPADPPLPGHRAIGTMLVDDNGQPRQSYIIEPIAPEQLVAERVAALAARRWQAETAGITINGQRIMTDRESQNLITGAALQAVIDPNYALIWKTGSGDFVSLGAADILAVAQTVRSHVQACFNREAELAALIRAAADPSSVDIETGWPA